MNLDKNVNLQLQATKAGLGWTAAHLSAPSRKAEYMRTRRELIGNRVKLNRIKFASAFNPAAALFGESQVGKSYMVDALLSDKQHPLAIHDKNGVRYEFIESINPIGHGSEATAIISRFSRMKFSDNPDFPVRVVLLSPVDAVMLLCDSYYNDLKDPKFPKEADILNEMQRIEAKYSSSSNEIQRNLTPDNVFEIREYFKDINFKKGDEFRSYLESTGYFDLLSSVMSSIPVEDWDQVFSFLWNRDKNLSEIFNILISALRKLDFRQFVYIPIEPLLRVDGTILHVDRMYELFGLKEVSNNGKTFEVEPAKVPDLKVFTGEGTVTISKGEFCALASEVDFTIDKMADAEAGRLDVLDSNIDILDFPGARSREDYSLESVSKFEASQMLIRGKIAYLFNKYSRQYLISNLLFCHHDTKSEVSSLSDLLRGWVEETIGATPQERQAYVQDSDIEPLFIIGTKFNIDMEIDPMDLKGNEEARLQMKSDRWNKRFNKVLSHVLGTNATWLNEWTPGRSFKNMYLLRSFEYSQFKGIFKAQKQVNVNGQWIASENGILREHSFGEFCKDGVSYPYSEFIPALRETFVNNDFVRTYFRDPRLSWDKVATMNNDGAEWIIENLLKAANVARSSRERKFEQIARACCDSFCDFAARNYHDDSKDQDVRLALDEAGGIQLYMDALFGKDKYFFTDFVSSFLVTEDWAHDTIMDAIARMNVDDRVDLSHLFSIRDRAEISSTDTEDEAMDKLMESYHFSSKQRLSEYLESLKISVPDLINPPKMLNAGLLIVNAVEQQWFSEVLRVDRFKDMIDRGMPAQSIEVILSKMEALYYKKIGLTEKMVLRIRPYITDPGKMDEMVEMIADICTEMINTFVTSFGTAYFDEALWDSIRDNISQNGLDITVDTAHPMDVYVDDEKVRGTMNDIFDALEHLDEVVKDLDHNRSRLQLISYYSSYREWTEDLKVAFLALCDVPIYDPVANKEMGIVILNNLIRQEELFSIAPDSIKNLSIAKAA